MKYRQGFVANSSSSSFICDICWEAEHLDDEDIVTCDEGHIMCIDSITTKLDINRDTVWETYENRLPKDVCLCCTGKVLAYSDYIHYIEESLGGRKDIIPKLKNKSRAEIYHMAGKNRGKLIDKENAEKKEMELRPGTINLRRDECLIITKSSKTQKSGEK